VTWRPGQPLELPAAGRATTLILHDVNQLTIAAQEAVLRWLDLSAGRIWVVSTSTEPLWPQVESGAFSDTLYYRLNIVCVRVPPEED
jgi:transcriptional regulator of acetoin/glycerol metabolism